MNKKILFVSDRPDRPEAHLMLGVGRYGFDVVTLCDPKAPLFDTLRAGVRVEPLKIHSRFDRAAAATIRSAIHSFSPDIIHSFTARGLAAALRATKRESTPHVAYRGTIGHLSWFDPSAWISYLHPRVSQIVSVSDAVMQYLAKFGIAERKLCRIYKGHRPEWYGHYSPIDRSSLQIPQNAFVATFVGNMRKVKGADLLLQSLEYLPSDGSVHLILVGEVRDPQIEKMLRKGVPPYVHMVGFTPEPLRYIKASDVFVMPSREREGLPKAVLEAMAVGVPPIVSRVGGMPELVEDGKSGLVVPPSDPQAIAAAILRFAKDRELLTRCAKESFRRVNEIFTIERTIEEHVTLYQKLLM